MNIQGGISLSGSEKPAIESAYLEQKRTLKLASVTTVTGVLSATVHALVELRVRVVTTECVIASQASAIVVLIITGQWTVVSAL